MCQIAGARPACREGLAKVDHSTGIHIHVDAAPFDARRVGNLIKIVNKQEALIEHAIGISDARRARWCRGIDQRFLSEIERRRPRSLEQLNQLWYGYRKRNCAIRSVELAGSDQGLRVAGLDGIRSC